MGGKMTTRNQKSKETTAPVRSEDVSVASPLFDIDLDLLPLPVAENICVFLSAPDVINLSKTCRFWHQIINGNSVWKKMVAHRYGNRAVKAEQENSSGSDDPPTYEAACSQVQVCSYKKLYFALATITMSVLELGITWLNNHYLVKEDTSDSQFGSVVHLCSVCWLHIKGSRKDMLPGTYRLSWRLKLHQVNIGGTTNFTAEPLAGYGDSLEKSITKKDWEQIEKENGSNQWFVMEMGTFKVTKQCDVTLQVVNTRDNWWKSGIWWDYVELKYVY